VVTGWGWHSPCVAGNDTFGLNTPKAHEAASRKSQGSSIGCKRLES